MNKLIETALFGPYNFIIISMLCLIFGIIDIWIAKGLFKLKLILTSILGVIFYIFGVINLIVFFIMLIISVGAYC